MPKLIVATKIPPLDRYLSENEELIARGFDIITLAFDNTAGLVQSAAQEAIGKDMSISPPVIILSSTIGKGVVIEDTIYTLRALGYRVVLLPGDATEESTQSLVKSVIALGVYDFIYDPYTGENVVFRILNPATLADIDLPDDNSSNDDEEEFLKEKGAGFNHDSGFIKRLADKVIGSAQQFTESVENNVVQPRKRRGKLTVLIGTSNSFIGDWINENFSDDIEVIGSVAEPENFKQKTLDISPDICVLVRESELGGIAVADHLAIWAAQNVQSVLFIVGVLDELGKNMATRAKDAGVDHIVTCQEGERIYGGELVYVITNIIKELQGAEQATEVESISTATRKTIGSLLQGAGIIGKAISADSTSEKAKRTTKTKRAPKIKVNKREGVSLEEKLDANFNVQNLKNPTVIVPGGLLAVVSPWRPNLAGRLAAHAVKILNEVEGGEIAYVGASKNSTGALWMDVPENVLMMSDWRVPGSNYPIEKDNIRIYAVDPIKDLSPDIESELWSIVKQARKTATYTVIDFAGDISSAQKAAHQGRSVLLVILPGNDPVELKISSLWLRNFFDGKQNVVTGIDLRGVPQIVPEDLKPKVIIRNNPADALTIALSKNTDDEFIWN